MTQEEKQLLLADLCGRLTYVVKVYTHKGNCRFCTERRKQELEELVEQLKEK